MDIVNDREELPLSKAALNLLQECRMVLPGIHVLFGFQLMVVFHPRFAERLSPFEQHLHLLATSLVAIAIALIMTPAAYHRQTRPRRVTEGFIRLSSLLLLCSMLPLAVSISLEFYLICRVILPGTPVAMLAVGMFALFAGLWFVLPRLMPRDQGEDE